MLADLMPPSSAMLSRHEKPSTCTSVFDFGRGYVQLTWWSNYVDAGVALKRGLDLLFDPLLAKDPQVAYDVMAHGMITGGGFANGRKLSDYIHGIKKDYVNARRMVNAGDAASYQPIAEIA